MTTTESIWKPRQTFIGRRNWPGGHRCPYCGKATSSTPCWCISPNNPNAVQMPDLDGLHVLGRFPQGFLAWVLRKDFLRAERNDVLHVCSGALRERLAIDLRPEVKPAVVANGESLPFRNDSVAAVLMDPPYSDEYARNLYGTKNPRPSRLLREAARVVRPQGRIAMVHVAVPMTPPGCSMVECVGVTTGAGFRIRALTIYEKEQRGLFA